MRRATPLLALLLVAAPTPDRLTAPADPGVVSAASPEATSAGLEILAAGGNAIDAAVATAFTLAVTEPAMSGLGAGLQIILMAPGGEARVVNGTSFAPAATPTTATARDLTGHRRTTIPTAVKALEHAWRHHGSGRISWPALLAAAIRHAEEGFVVGPFRARVFARHRDDLLASPSARALFVKPDGTVPVEGDTVRQPVLARTLRRLAERGAQDFYEGEIAREIAADMATQGGWITLEDLRRLPAPRELPALSGRYRGFDVYTLTPPAGGWVVLQILNLLEFSTPAELAPGTPTRAERLSAALRIGHGNRQRDPITDLVRYEAEATERTGKAYARRALEEARRRGNEVDGADETAGRGETTHFSVVDGHGMAVGITASINAYFGSRTATPSLGFLYNDYMAEFETGQPDHPFAIGPGRMPYSSMSATILARNGRPVLVLGSPGSARIISAVAQVAQLWADGHHAIREAVDAPRMHVVPEERLYLEDSAVYDVQRRALEAMGFRFVTPADDLALRNRNAYWGGVHAVALEGSRWVGAADPRRDGAAGSN